MPKLGETIFSMLEARRISMNLGVRELLRKSDVSSTVYYRLKAGGENIRLSTIEKLFTAVGGKLSFEIILKKASQNHE